jgi:hypothetical protein
MTKDEALKIALEALEDVQDMMSTSDWFNERVEVVRQALAEPDTGIDRGAWSDVPDATKWVDDLRGEDEPPTDSQIIAGAIFDFAGFLTTRDKVIKVGASAKASPVADLVKEWANMRELSLDDAAVMWWSDVLEEPPNSTTDVVEPIAWVVPDFGFLFPDEISAQRYLDNTESGAKPTPLYTAPPQREWVGLKDEEKDDMWNTYCDEMGNVSISDSDEIFRAVEAKLKEKNHVS